MDNKVAIRVCECDGARDHAEFLESSYQFPDGTIETLYDFCPENDQLAEELYHQYKPIIKTLITDENWTMFAYYAGQIAEVRPGLYFYSFGDLDEIGERNFYIKGDLESVIEMLLEEWGEEAPPWRKLFSTIATEGYPQGYAPESMVDAKTFFPTIDEPTLEVGISYNTENEELQRILRSL